MRCCGHVHQIEAVPFSLLCLHKCDVWCSTSARSVAGLLSRSVPPGVLLTASPSSERHLCKRSCYRAAFVLCKLFFLSSSGMVAIISLSFSFSWSSWHEEAAFQFWHLGLNVCQRMSEEAEWVVFMRTHVQRRVMWVEVKDVCTRQGRSLSALIVLLSTGRETIY